VLGNRAQGQVAFGSTNLAASDGGTARMDGVVAEPVQLYLLILDFSLFANTLDESTTGWGYILLDHLKQLLLQRAQLCWSIVGHAGPGCAE